jgi:hypothetical protein
MIKLAIIHFQPLEKYPPIVNLLNYLSENQIPAVVFTTRPPHTFEPYKNDFHQIKRFPSINGASRLRILHYLAFYLGSILHLIKARPSHLIWMETLSSFPAIIYSFLRYKKPKLFVHYHEYESPFEIQNGMFLSRLFHKMEEKVYPQLTWLSHTNQDRMNLFVNDHPEVNPQSLRIMPNYPPKWWNNYQNKTEAPNQTRKLVYVGALSAETTYLKELLQLIHTANGHLTCDFYSFSIDNKTQNLFDQYQSPNICFKGAIAQTDFPKVISQYHIGLILYKGHIPNYVFNAPNKLFEYLACGLDVWYPDVMTGTKPYTALTSLPKVVPVNFDDIRNFDWRAALSHENTIPQSTEYYCENVYEDLVKVLENSK